LPAFERRQGREGVVLFRRIPVSWFGGGMAAVTESCKGDGVLRWLRGGWRSAKDGNVTWFEQWLLPNGDLTATGRQKLQEKIAALESAEANKWRPEPLPADWEALLLAYQVEGARRLAHALRVHGGGWDCSDLGTGKTFQSLCAALSVAQELKRDVAVICPKSVIPPWHKAFRHFCGERPAWILNYDTARNGKLPKYEIYGKGLWLHQGSPTRSVGGEIEFVRPEKLVLIFDEAHNCKNGGTKNAALMLAALRQKIPMLCVSGTIANNPMEMFATGQVTALHTGKNGPNSHFAFMLRHGCRQGWDGQLFFADRTKLVPIHQRIFGEDPHTCRGTRIRIAELGDAFPETQIVCEAFESGEAAKIGALYHEAQQEIERIGHVVDEQTRQNLERAAYMKIRQEVEKLKIKGAVQLIKEEYEAGRSVAVFCNFNEVRETLVAELQTVFGADFRPECQIHGTQNSEQRQKAIELFQSDESRAIVCNLSAGGVGVSLHDVNGEYPRTAVIFPSDRAVDVKQGLGRVHRAGGKSRSRQIVYFAADTPEEAMVERLRGKLANFDTLNDGDLQPKLTF
jgi:SNF2 family DNA or RNA helicase